MRRTNFVESASILLLVFSVFFFGFTVGPDVATAENCGLDCAVLMQKFVNKQGVVTWVPNTLSPQAYLKFKGVTQFPCDPNAGCTSAPQGIYYKWSYEFVTSNGAHYNFGTSEVNWLVPATTGCTPNSYFCITGTALPGPCTASDLSSPGGNGVMPGTFNPYVGLGLWGYQTLKSTRDDSSGSWIFFTKENSTPRTTTLYLKGAAGNEFLVQTLGPSVPEPTVLIETSCEQIRKNSVPPKCLNVCYEMANGVTQGIISAELYNDAVCDGSGGPPKPLMVFPKNSPHKSLACLPCNFNNSLPGPPPAPDCPINSTNLSSPPFRLAITDPSGITAYKSCDVLQYERQNLGFTAVMGEDPWRMVNGTLTWFP